MKISVRASRTSAPPRAPTLLAILFLKAHRNVGSYVLARIPHDLGDPQRFLPFADGAKMCSNIDLNAVAQSELLPNFLLKPIRRCVSWLDIVC